MESAEAIMENENNSNLESESNIRERDQQILERSNEENRSYPGNEEELLQGRNVTQNATDLTDSGATTNKSEEDCLAPTDIEKTNAEDGKDKVVSFDLAIPEGSHSKAQTASDLSADILEDYEDFTGVYENSEQENIQQKISTEESESVETNSNPASDVDKINEEPTEIQGTTLQEEPMVMEDDNFSLDVEEPNELSEPGEGRETQSMEVDEEKQPVDGSSHSNREDLGFSKEKDDDLDLDTVKDVDLNLDTEKHIEAFTKKSDAEVEVSEKETGHISNSDMGESANAANDWEDDIDLLADDSEQGAESSKNDDSEIQSITSEILPKVDESVTPSKPEDKINDLEENVEQVVALDAEAGEKQTDKPSTAVVEAEESADDVAPAMDPEILLGENVTQEMTDDLREESSAEQEDSSKDEDFVTSQASDENDKVEDSPVTVENTAVKRATSSEETIAKETLESHDTKEDGKETGVISQRLDDRATEINEGNKGSPDDVLKIDKEEETESMEVSEDNVVPETENTVSSKNVISETAESILEGAEPVLEDKMQASHEESMDISQTPHSGTTESVSEDKNQAPYPETTESVLEGKNLAPHPDTTESVSEDKNQAPHSDTTESVSEDKNQAPHSDTIESASEDKNETPHLKNAESALEDKLQASQEESMDINDGVALDSLQNHETSDKPEIDSIGKELVAKPNEIEQLDHTESKTETKAGEMLKTSSPSHVADAEGVESVSELAEIAENSAPSELTESKEATEKVEQMSVVADNTESNTEKAQSSESPLDNDSVKQTDDTVSTNMSITSETAEKINTNNEKTMDNGNSQPATDETMATEDDDDDDVVKTQHIKKELITGTADEKSADDAPKSETISQADIKQEPDALRSGDGDDVVVLDDEGEVLPVKKEADEAKANENGLGIQISAVSGLQHQLHADAGDISSSASTPATPKSESPKSKSSSKSKMQTCIVCQKHCRCKYNIVRNGDIKHLCDDSCFKLFRKCPSSYLKNKDSAKASKTTTSPPSSKAQETSAPSAIQNALQTPQSIAPGKPAKDYKTCAICKLINHDPQQPFCNWKGLDFCSESCLGKFQANLNTSCSFCHAYIPMDMRATFCLKIGNDMRPFCKQRCYNEFKKKLRLCAFCQRDVAAVPEAFTAMVGSSEKFKEFCSQACRKKLEDQINDVEIISVEKGSLKQEPITCSVCKKPKVMKHTIRYQGTVNKLCSDLCLSAFQYINKLELNKCDYCGTGCTTEESQAHFVQFEGQVKRFCSDQCVGNFRKSNGKSVPCKWCGTWKTNFDMIERVDGDNKFQMFCSLNCLSLYRVNLQAKSNQAVTCDQCQKVVPAQYHLTMSDASVRNFCSYSCVMTFQSQFGNKQVPPAPQPPQQQQKAAGGKGRSRASGRRGSKQQPPPSVPVISNVMSLALQGAENKQQAANLQAPVPSSIPNLAGQNVVGVPGNENLVPSGDGKHQILIQAASPKSMKNKSLQCRPLTQTKATSCRPHSQTKETQTDETPAKSVFVPIPVPIYIPMPTVMYSAPTPTLVPFPLPIPVPVFIPTTRKSANGISKTIKEIVERMPADPLEAELLMMAEAVASDKRPGDSDTDSENDGPADDFEAPAEEEEIERPETKEEDSFIMKKREGQGEEDMIQMALRMAEEMSGPIEDLESSVQPVAVNTEPPSQPQVIQSYQEQVDEDYIPAKSMRGRGAKRQSRGRPPASRPKRQRVERPYQEEEPTPPQPALIPQTMEPPPDANYRLKFTYGVNAWRHWVISKNSQIEKTKQTTGSHRMRTFPTDILKCTTDELNFTLCMFIKEVRKPSGDEYSPDSIYYLCLGIQQYLYENGRIDNIFTDMYFEKFTDCLHETLKTLQPKVNNQGQMLCRIEEEHLWESKQLGAHSPYVLLNTLIYFHTKHFILKTAQEHMSLSFAQILKHWKKGMPVKGQAASSGKNVSLRFYCLANGKKDGLAARKNKEGVPVYEVTENFDNPLRCPVKLYEFFLSKCPESIKNRNDIFYPVPERSCVPDSPVWYSTQSIDIHTMDKMLTRVLLVREIQEAHLHAQPIYL